MEVSSSSTGDRWRQVSFLESWGFCDATLTSAEKEQRRGFSVSLSYPKTNKNTQHSRTHNSNAHAHNFVIDMCTGKRFVKT
jgi:hypothetical protein